MILISCFLPSLVFFNGVRLVSSFFTRRTVFVLFFFRFTYILLLPLFRECITDDDDGDDTDDDDDDYSDKPFN